MAVALMTNLRSGFPEQPEELGVSFGVKASAELSNLVVARGGMEANYNVSLRWRSKDKDKEKENSKKEEKRTLNSWFTHAARLIARATVRNPLTNFPVSQSLTNEPIPSLRQPRIVIVVSTAVHRKSSQQFRQPKTGCRMLRLSIRSRQLNHCCGHSFLILSD